jgi:hypothetical protein
MSLSGQQFKALQNGLIAAFDHNSLTQMLRFELDKRLGVIAGGDDMETLVFNLIDRAEREGWVLDLLRAARVTNPRNAVLHEAADILSLSSTRELKPAALNFEKVVREGVPFLDPAVFRSRLGQLELQVCSVEIDGVGQGSGLLVGPGHVLTNQYADRLPIRFRSLRGRRRYQPGHRGEGIGRRARCKPAERQRPESDQWQSHRR